MGLSRNQLGVLRILRFDNYKVSVSDFSLSLHRFVSSSLFYGMIRELCIAVLDGKLLGFRSR